MKKSEYTYRSFAPYNDTEVPAIVELADWHPAEPQTLYDPGCDAGYEHVRVYLILPHPATGTDTKVYHHELTAGTVYDNLVDAAHESAYVDDEADYGEYLRDRAIDEAM